MYLPESMNGTMKEVIEMPIKMPMEIIMLELFKAVESG